MTNVSNFTAVLGVTALATLAAACGFEHKSNVISPTSPTTSASTTTPTATSMTGIWASNAALPAGAPDPTSCGNFQFFVMDQTATTIAGSFTATCGGGVSIQGSGNGQLNGTAVTVTVSGTGTGSIFPSGCTFTLSGSGNLEDEGYALPLTYSGTTCLGPVRGSTTLRRSRPAAPPPPPPPPAPEPPPPPPAPAPPSAPNGFNLNNVRIVGGSPDVRGWPITSRITMLEMGGGAFKIDHTRRCSWPGVDMGGAIQEATIWIFQQINGQWYGTGGERLRPCQTEKQLGRPSEIWSGWFYNDYWAPFTGRVPAVGEPIGFMITAGSTRADNNAPVHERTGIVMINYPGDGGGRYPGWLWQE
jgi:hypothetical protein